MKKILSKLFTIRIRMDLRDNCPMIAFYFLGFFSHACKYNPKTKMFNTELTEEEYMHKTDELSL